MSDSSASFDSTDSSSSSESETEYETSRGRYEKSRIQSTKKVTVTKCLEDVSCTKKNIEFTRKKKLIFIERVKKIRASKQKNHPPL